MPASTATLGEVTVQLPDHFQRLIRSRCRFLLPDDPLGPDTSLADLGVDSLEIVELIVDIEDTYGIEVPLEFLTPEMFASPGTIWQGFRGMIAEAGNGAPGPSQPLAARGARERL